MQTDYTNMKNALASSGRSILYSICAWQYQSWMPTTGNLWRTTTDIANNWNSMIGNYDINVGLYASAAPGAWNDPDMLEVGNGGMTDTEYRTHISLWAILAAPLIAGNDLRNMRPEIHDILTNKEVIAIDQDALGREGERVARNGELEVWAKQLKDGSRAVLLLNRGESEQEITANWEDLGYPATLSASVRDLWEHKDLGKKTGKYSARVAPHGVVMVTVKP